MGMRWIFALALLAGCAPPGGSGPPAYPSYGAIHGVTAFYSDGTWTYGTAFAIGQHDLVTASHVLRSNGLAPYAVQVEGRDVDVEYVDPADNAPARLLSAETWTTYLTPRPATFVAETNGEVDSIYQRHTGCVIYAYSCTVTGFTPRHGESGAPVIDRDGYVVGVLTSGDGDYVFWEPLR